VPTDAPITTRRRLNPDFRYPPGVITPWEFAVAFLGIHLYGWQALILEAIGQGIPTALAAANGSGKTRKIVAPAILWLLFYWPRGLVPVTSGSWTQLEQQLWPALLEHQSKFPNWDWPSMRIHTPEGGRAFLFSTNDSRRAEGNHGSWPDAPCMYIIDEGKSVDDGIYTASDRCTAQYRFICSSTGGPFGRFFECFHTLNYEYFTRRVMSSECPHLAEKFERDSRLYPADDPEFRSMHFSEFMDEDGPGVVVSPGSLRTCLDADIAHVPASRAAFCDFAAGGDENCIAIADGNKVELIRCWRDTDPIRACKDFIAEFQRMRLVPAEIHGDEGGLGTVMISYLAEMGWRITPVNNGAPAQDEDHYCNRGSEIWFQSAKQILKKEVILPDDAIFFRQATTRRRDYDSKMRLRAEPKDAMAARGLKSPDRADAVFGALYCRAGGAVTREQLAGIYLPSTSFEREELTFAGGFS
jgi:phage terminase large subunit